MRDKSQRLVSLCLLTIAVMLLPAGGGAAERHPAIQRRVMAFYYPWYGTPDGPGGAGRTVHWGDIDAANQDIAASTHYPSLGAYDSRDPEIIDQHCRSAKAAHIDTFIVSWWGHGSYSDRAMDKILQGCLNHGMRACIYYETVPQPQNAQTAAADIVAALEKYGSHRAYLKADGSPVVFVYGRAVNELGLIGWLEAVQTVKASCKGGATVIGDQFSYGAARVFDGVHTYNTAGSLRELSLDELSKWTVGTYESWVRLADRADRISTITVIPGYDDTKIRTPGLAVERYEGQSYRIQWQQAIAADPHWVLITSFNEWHEGSEIEPSVEYGDQYMGLTAEFAGRFKATSREDRPVVTPGGISPEQKDLLRRRLAQIPIAVLPGAESMAFWWLLEIGTGPTLLTWHQVADGELTSKDYRLLLYCSGEHYRRTVRTTGDVDEALVQYLKAGGFLAALPSRPWPFYYDEDGDVVNQSRRFGLTLRMGWEQPPEGISLWFVQPSKRLPHVPARFDFPTIGDLRWRGFFAQDQREHVPLLRLRKGRTEYLGDAVAYAEPADGGKVLYVWFGLLDGPHAEPLLYDVFTFLADRLYP